MSDDRRPTDAERRMPSDGRQTTNDDKLSASVLRPSSFVERQTIDADKPSSPVQRPSSIGLHIDELVLHGFAASDRHAIGAAVERELARLIGEQGLPPAIGQSGERWRLDGGAFNLAAGAPAQVIGTQVARAVYAGLVR
jgi:hypothetical protein